MDPCSTSVTYTVHPVETVPLQDRHQVSRGQPAGPTGGQHIVVNVPTEPPADYLVWSLWNFIYGNICCLGFVAVVYSVRARDRKLVGDQEGARRHASIARALNITATVLMSLLVFLAIVVPTAMIAQGASYYNNEYNRNINYNNEYNRNINHNNGYNGYRYYNYRH
ncbi:dispanin subfamily A member 2b-like [Gambusia affinis]|uniref:dispanin subfamily A member 2b-like n=1 Tax=Gambusia affinis TaxID=33528 RepID=UPI001CDD1A7A|nr:dispanin subfamily A member 2b-like [Gambusia affinis]